MTSNPPPDDPPDDTDVTSLDPHALLIRIANVQIKQKQTLTALSRQVYKLRIEAEQATAHAARTEVAASEARQEAAEAHSAAKEIARMMAERLSRA